MAFRRCQRQDVGSPRASPSPAHATRGELSKFFTEHNLHCNQRLPGGYCAPWQREEALERERVTPRWVGCGFVFSFHVGWTGSSVGLGRERETCSEGQPEAGQTGKLGDPVPLDEPPWCPVLLVIRPTGDALSGLRQTPNQTPRQ